MKFQTRLLFTYSVLVFFLTVVLGITFYVYTSRLFENNAASTYRLLSSRMSVHLDNLIHPMDFITANLISDYDFRTALTTLATLDRSNPQNGPLINDAVQTIKSNLLFADVLLISIPPLILFIIFNRRIVSGIVAGAVKG